MPLSPLTAESVTKSYADRTVLDGVGLTAAPGQRVGLIGENGVGKSTLLRLLAGVEQPDAGTISFPLDLAYVSQEPSFQPQQTLAEVLDEALAPLHQAVRDVERLATAMTHDNVADEFNERLEWARSHDAWDANRRATLAVASLGLGEVPRTRLIGELSGGQRTRLALAVVITRQPECILLDEPTNHLDDEAMELLETFLVGLPGVVVAASHDRVFLDRVCTHLVDLDPSALGTDGAGGNRFGGTFTEYLGHKAAARARWEQTYLDQQARLNELRAATKLTTQNIAHDRQPRDNDKFIYSFKGGRVQGALARRVRDAERRLAVAEREQVRKPPALLRFAAPLAAPDSGERLALSIRDLTVPGRVEVPLLDVPTGGKVLITGANGSGKSSLLSVIVGTLAPVGGQVSVGARRVELLEQDVTFADMGLAADQTFGAAVSDGSAPLAELGLLHPRDAGKPVGNLSVGQRRRLRLAILIARHPDLLLLDEPTNHISLTLATELEQALHTTSGTVLVASHDRWLRRRWEQQVLALPAA
ncbi:MAG: ABC-F family ATP-binding cassette domain-containing protein [Jatrophihabitans sp.]